MRQVGLLCTPSKFLLIIERHAEGQIPVLTAGQEQKNQASILLCKGERKLVKITISCAPQAGHDSFEGEKIQVENWRQFTTASVDFYKCFKKGRVQVLNYLEGVSVKSAICWVQNGVASTKKGVKTHPKKMLRRFAWTRKNPLFISNRIF